MFFLLINSIKPTGFLESQQQVVNDVWNEKSFLAQWAGRENWQCFLTAALTVTSKHRDGHVPAVTSVGIQGEHVWAHRQTPVSPGIPPPSHTLPEPKEYVVGRNAASDPAVCPLGTAAAGVLSRGQDHPAGATSVRGFVCVMHCSGGNMSFSCCSSLTW